MGTPPTGPPSGRPRDPAIDAAIATATLELLAERGFAGLTVVDVAKRAGTTPPAIYRRYPTKVDLVVAVVFRTDGDDVVADTGDLAADIRSMVRWALEKYASPAGRAAMAGLLATPFASGPPSPPLVEAWSRTRARLERAAADGEIAADVDASAVVATLTGAALFVASLQGEGAVSDRWVERIASVVLDGIRPSATTATTAATEGA